MSLSAAAAGMGVPEALVQRAAAARAAASGSTVEAVLAFWTGGGSVPAPVAAPASEAPAQPAESAPAAEAAPAPAAMAVPAAPAAPITATRAPVPTEVSVAEAAHIREVVTVPTAGIRERTSFKIPKWLVAVLLIVPTFALTLLGGSATGACGDATELSVDVVTGEIVNCDGSTFTGSGAGGGGVNFLALGEAIYNGQGATCAGCHGAGGGGGPAGPSLAGVLTTFGVCADHVEWVKLGGPGFTAEGRSTYGDTDKPVGGFGGVMPGHASLSDEQLASVAAFERVQFGGADPDATLVDCGLVEGEGGEAGAGTEAPAEAAAAGS